MFYTHAIVTGITASSSTIYTRRLLQIALEMSDECCDDLVMVANIENVGTNYIAIAIIILLRNAATGRVPVRHS